MSEQNVEIAKRALDAFNRRDLVDFFELATPDLEWVPALLAGFEGGTIRGRDGLETFFRDIPETWDEFHAVASDFRDVGDALVVLGQAQGRGRGSGVSVDAPVGLVLDFRDGRISRARAYLDHGEALRVAGLEK